MFSLTMLDIGGGANDRRTATGNIDANGNAVADVSHVGKSRPELPCVIPLGKAACILGV